MCKECNRFYFNSGKTIEQAIGFGLLAISKKIACKDCGMDEKDEKDEI